MSTVGRGLGLQVKRGLKAIPEGDFGKLSSEARAIRYAIDHSGLQEKTIAIEIDTDAGTLSKAKQGQARLNEDALHALMDATGLEAPLYALLLRRGYDPRSLRRIETDVERENRELHERIATMEREHAIELRVIQQLMRGATA